MGSDTKFFLGALSFTVAVIAAAVYLGSERAAHRRAEAAAARASWQEEVNSGRCRVESFGFDKYGRAVSAVYLCADTGRHIGPVLR